MSRNLTLKCLRYGPEHEEGSDVSPGGQADGRTDGGGDGNKFTESEGYRSEKQNAKLPSSLSLGPRFG